MTRRLLYIAQWFPPCQAWPSASARARNLLLGLKACGWEVTALVPDMSSGLCRCAGCLSGDRRVEGIDVRRIAVRPSLAQRVATSRRPTPPPPAARSAPVRRSSGETGVLRDHLVTLWWVLGGTHSNWIRSAYGVARRLIGQDAVDVLLTTSGPFEHLSLGRRLQAATGVPWVAELRDPARVPSGVGGFESVARLRRAPLRRCLRAADAIVAATEQVRIVDGPWIGQPVTLVLSGFDEALWNQARTQAKPGDGFSIVFAGRVYEHYRRPDLFMRGFGLFLDSLPESDRNAVRFHYYGRDGHLVAESAATAGVSSWVVDHGFVDPSLVPGRLAEATVLLLLTNEAGDSGVPGGKYFEYLGAHRPILAVPGVDEFVRETLRATGAGRSTSSEEGVAEALRHWHMAWSPSKHLAFDGDAAAIARYGSRHSAAELAGVLEHAIGAGPASNRGS